MALYYKPSGKFSPLAFLTFTLLSFTVFPLLGLIYAYAIWYIPFIYINFLLAAGFGFGIGLLIKKFSIRLGKVRNPILGILFGLFGGFIAMYFHWAVWVDLVLNVSDTIGGDRFGLAISNISVLEVFSLAFNPSTLFNLISEIQAIGTWGISGGNVSGIFLSIVWIIELGIVVFLSVITSSPGARAPFSEIQNTWYEETALPAFDFITEPEKIITALESDIQDLAPLLNRPHGLSQSHSIFTVYTCTDDAHLLAVENKIAKTNKKGEIEFDDQDVIQHIYISDSVLSQLLNFPAEPTSTSAARDAFEKL